jgi:GNAT superfamily N-acetyltransferase
MLGDVTITSLSNVEIDSLHYLVDEFVLSHGSLRFRDNYWAPVRDWLLRLKNDENSRVLAAKSNGRIIGFAVGQILDNGPLLYPERIGYGSIMVVAAEFRNSGIGDALWLGMKDYFLRKGIEQVEIYTECGNTVAETFWENRGFSIFLNRRKCSIAEHG